ncbi:MAG: hypothetical protein LCI00_24210 [Chloroflexi bacterium]|nr:hypothetical protein [Chloroflexota bacterium]MCC6895868.1 hypothetical protein [Anaerolineae bacterium]
MTKGYRVIEPTLINSIIVDSKYHAYAVSVLFWLVEEIYKALKDQIDTFDIEVIKVEYMGAYPALGVQYQRKPFEAPNYSLEKLIEETSNRLLSEKSISELTKYIAASEVDWNEMASWVMTERHVASTYRIQVWNEFYPYHPFDYAVDQLAFRDMLENAYEAAKEKLRSSNNENTTRKYLFLSAIGLLAYGFLNTVPDIVESGSLVNKDYRWLISILNFIFPTPKGMNVFNDPDDFKIWLQANSSNLYFKESAGKFTFIQNIHA